MLVYSNSEVMMMSPEGSRSPEAGEEGRERVFVCTMCSYRTDRKNNLKRHTLTMHEVCPALLECCGLRFLNKAELRMHTSKFHRQGYRCDVCNRIFCRKALLKRHYSVHSGYKEFSCHRCSYQTSHKSNLERHMRVHQKPEAPLGQRQAIPPEFLPELPPARRHVSPALNLQQAFLPAHPLALLPHYHGAAHLYRRPGGSGRPSPWSMLPVVSPASVPAALHHLPQQPPPQVYSAESQRLGPRLARASHKKTRGPCNFSMAALLADHPSTQDKRQPEMMPSTNLHLPPPQGSTWWSVGGEDTWPPVQTAATSSGHGPGVTTPSYMSSGVVKPTALHASTAFHANPVHANPINSAVHATSTDYVLDLTSDSTSRLVGYMAEAQDMSAEGWQPAPETHTDDLAFFGQQYDRSSQEANLGQSPVPDTTPARPHTPAREHQDSSASSGYGSPGVNDSPRIPGSIQGTEEGVECALDLKVQLQPEQLLLHMDFHHEYVPKKLRLSKKFKDAPKSSGGLL